MNSVSIKCNKTDNKTYSNTMFRQAFLLSQYSFMYNILSVQTHNIGNISLKNGKQNS